MNSSGYLQVMLWKDGKGKNHLVHRLVAIAFLPEPSKEILDECKNTKIKVPLVNHKDLDKTNNNYLNLEWATYSSNNKHAAESKTFSNGRTNLTWDCVNCIRAEYEKVKGPIAKFARENASRFNTSERSIKKILYKEAWNY